MERDRHKVWSMWLLCRPEKADSVRPPSLPTWVLPFRCGWVPVGTFRAHVLPRRFPPGTVHKELRLSWEPCVFLDHEVLLCRGWEGPGIVAVDQDMDLQDNLCGNVQVGHSRPNSLPSFHLCFPCEPHVPDYHHNIKTHLYVVLGHTLHDRNHCTLDGDPTQEWGISRGI
ncbi:hypothetical protein Q8A73_005795 [Channa argus]|nr:hypothetical protein Q8A73_005795 [Channa argus]